MDNQNPDQIYHAISDATRRAVVARPTAGPPTAAVPAFHILRKNRKTRPIFRHSLKDFHPGESNNLLPDGPLARFHARITGGPCAQQTKNRGRM